MSAIGMVEQAAADEAAGRIDRATAIAQVRAVLDVTETSAASMLDNPAAARARYEREFARAADLRQRLLGGEL